MTFLLKEIAPKLCSDFAADRQLADRLVRLTLSKSYLRFYAPSAFEAALPIKARSLVFWHIIRIA